MGMMGRILPLLLLCLLLTPAAFFCRAEDTTSYEVVGTGECADCQKNNFKTNQAFSGLHVTIECKVRDGEIKRVAAGELDEEGKFRVPLPKAVVEEVGGKEKKLKHDCYAQLHNAGAKPCPGRVDAGKIVFKSENVFGPAKNLEFSTPLCASKFFWSYFKYPPLPTTLPKFPLPHSPLNFFGHTFPLPPIHPFFKHPPFFTPPEVVKPKPPVIYKPPVVTKPPVYKPPVVTKPPVYKPPAVEKPPVFTKPIPPSFPYFSHPPLPFFKHPLPPPFPYFSHPPFPYFSHPPLPFFKHPLPPPFPYFSHPPFPYFKHPLPPPFFSHP